MKFIMKRKFYIVIILNLIIFASFKIFYFEIICFMKNDFNF